MEATLLAKEGREGQLPLTGLPLLAAERLQRDGRGVRRQTEHHDPHQRQVGHELLGRHVIEPGPRNRLLLAHAFPCESQHQLVA